MCVKLLEKQINRKLYELSVEREEKGIKKFIKNLKGLKVNEWYNLDIILLNLLEEGRGETLPKNAALSHFTKSKNAILQV